MKLRELFNKNFEFTFKAVTYNNMRVAIQAFEQFKKRNEEFFSFDKKDVIFGHLRTYAIERQFYNSAFSPQANYTVTMKQVNNYKYKTLFIETKDFVVNLGRTNSKFELLPASLYKKDAAKANTGLNSQLTFDFSSNVPKIIECKKYAQIIYGYSYGEITHLNIVLPSSDYSGIEVSIDVLEGIKLYKNYIPKELIEESIVTLKKSLLNKIKK